MDLGEFDKNWIRLVFALNWCLENYGPTAFTVQSKSAKFENGPYVQAQYLDDEIEIEVTSNRYLNPKISEFYIQRMNMLGWNDPDEDDHPNFWKVVPNTVEGRLEAATLWVRTLNLVFDLPVKSAFNFAPTHRKVYNEVGKYLKNIGTPMNFTLFDILADRRERAEQIKRAQSLLEARLEEERNPIKRTYLEPNAENFPDLFEPPKPEVDGMA